MNEPKPKPKRAPKRPAPKKPYARTNMPGGIARLIQICEDLRTRNTDGYFSPSLWLADIKNFGYRGRVHKATVCSPFTATVIGLAFDPKYPRDDLGGDPYVPLFNGENQDLLPYDFYQRHNGNQPIGSLAEYQIGEKIDAKKMRRGDILGIDWAGGGGHAVFCWDVHLDAAGDVDCFQMIGSHGSLTSNGSGVHIHGCDGERWLVGKPAKKGKHGTGTMAKAPGKSAIFVDEDEIVEAGTWFAIKGVKFKDIDQTTFRKTPTRISAPGSKLKCSRIGELQVGRLFYEGDAPAPYSMKGGPAAPAQKAPEPRGHMVAPVISVPKAEIKKDPEAVQKVAPKPVEQDKKKPLMMQKDVEMAMQEFFRAKWIAADPGVPDEINDAKSQAAIKAFQGKFSLDDDGIVGKASFAMIKKQLPACQLQKQAEEHLSRLFLGGVLKNDPGTPNGVNDAESAAAFKEFQASVKLKETGVPDADTQVKLKAAVDEHHASESQPGLTPTLEALYWLGNQAAPSGSARLRLHSRDL
ncbi:MAG: peptidoglycan-binding domain-containing protein, partial [Candidatus Eisenbacteria bacterium]